MITYLAHEFCSTNKNHKSFPVTKIMAWSKLTKITRKAISTVFTFLFTYFF